MLLKLFVQQAAMILMILCNKLIIFRTAAEIGIVKWSDKDIKTSRLTSNNCEKREEIKADEEKSFLIKFMICMRLIYDLFMTTIEFYRSISVLTL